MSNLIQIKESSRYPGLFVKKYSRKVFYDNLWNTDDSLLESRGHVMDRDGNIVIRPFTKIFNRGENNVDIHREEMCLAVSKINGFMATATYVPLVEEVIVSTTGSLDSDFVDLAEKHITERVKKYIKEKYLKTNESTSWMFEICDPTDPHIIKEYFGAYLIGRRNVSDTASYFSYVALEQELDVAAEEMGVLRPHYFYTDFGTIKQEVKDCSSEGVVVYGQESKTVLKIKSPYYLVLKMCARRKDILSLNKSLIDEEFFDLIDHLTKNRESFIMLDEQSRLHYMKEFLING